MLKTAFIIYRDWGYKIFKQIYAYQLERGDFILDTLIIAEGANIKVDKKYQAICNCYYLNPTDTDQIYKILKQNKVEIAMFYSWSFIVSQKLLDSFICLCLHPSKIPAFRGGTPIQNQLIRNVTDSAVTIFKMNSVIDGGDIYRQASMSLIGDVHHIFDRMVDLGAILTQELITDAVNQELKFNPQKITSQSKVYPRRKISQSQIGYDELINMTYRQLYNLVRGLLPPYPTAYISLETAKLYLFKIEKYKKLPKNVIVLKKNTDPRLSNQPIYIKLKDAYARIIQYKTTKNK